MKKAFFPLVMVAVLALMACASPAADNVTQPSISDEVATVVALTLQAPTLEVTVAPTNTNVPEVPASLLPHSLYYLSRDGTGLTQAFRMERDGKTATQLTFEPVNVTDYDVSLADGSVAYILNNQLVLVHADGSNRQVLVDGGPARNENSPAFFKDPLTRPVFSSDGQTIAYARYAGLHMYDISTGVSSLVIENQYTDVMLINGVEQALPIEIYTPGRYSPDGSKLLIHLSYTDHGSAAIYSPAGNTLLRLTDEEHAFQCCGAYREIEWSADSLSFYSANPNPGVDGGGMWRVDAITGAVTTIIPYIASDGTTNFLDEPYLAPDSQLYFFFANYSSDLGPLQRAPFELELVHSAPDGVTNRIALKSERFRLMNEALWAPEAGLVVMAFASTEDVRDGGLDCTLSTRQKKKAPTGQLDRHLVS